MIIIKIQGGLGNQLFQYSFGKLLEKKYSKKIAFDISFYTTPSNYTVRQFLLDKFKTKVRIATEEEIYFVKYPYGILSKLLLLFKKVLNKFIFKKYQIAYDRELLLSLEEKETAYLEGFWQSYHYVEPVIEELRKEILLHEPVYGEMKEYLEKVTSSNSVFVHVRRGDYLHIGKDLETLGQDYYKKAEKLMETKIDNPIYYIFSDDIIWVEREMSFLFKNAIYMQSGILKDYEELLVMSSCKHGIIANSSFSWWGAMLNSNENKVIIAPNDWKNIYFKGDINLCPKDWVLA